MGALELGRQALKGLQNLLQHTVGIPQHFVVPEAKYGQAMGTEESSPTLILFRAFGMLPAVEFDYQPSFAAEEVADERPDRHLSRKFEAAKLSMA